MITKKGITFKKLSVPLGLSTALVWGRGNTLFHGLLSESMCLNTDNERASMKSSLSAYWIPGSALVWG